MGTNPVLGDRGYKKVFCWVFSLVMQLCLRDFRSAHAWKMLDASALAISWITAYRDKIDLPYFKGWVSRTLIFFLLTNSDPLGPKFGRGRGGG